MARIAMVLGNLKRIDAFSRTSIYLPYAGMDCILLGVAAVF
jgi:hypothetical protein